MKKIFPRTTSSETQMLPEIMRGHWYMCLTKLNAEWPERYARTSAKPRVGYQVHCDNSTSFFWTLNSECNPRPFREISRTKTMKTRIVMRTILILKWMLQWQGPFTQWSQTQKLNFTASKWSFKYIYHQIRANVTAYHDFSLSFLNSFSFDKIPLIFV